jgi:hypothetical protein
MKYNPLDPLGNRYDEWRPVKLNLLDGDGNGDNTDGQNTSDSSFADGMASAIADMTGMTGMTDFAGSGLADFSSPGMTDFTGSGLADFSSPGMTDFTGSGLADFSSPGMTDFTGAGLADFSSPGMTDFTGAGLADFSSPGMTDFTGQSPFGPDQTGMTDFTGANLGFNPDVSNSPFAPGERGMTDFGPYAPFSPSENLGLAGRGMVDPTNPYAGPFAGPDVMAGGRGASPYGMMALGPSYTGPFAGPDVMSGARGAPFAPTDINVGPNGLLGIGPSPGYTGPFAGPDVMSGARDAPSIELGPPAPAGPAPAPDNRGSLDLIGPAYAGKADQTVNPNDPYGILATGQQNNMLAQAMAQQAQTGKGDFMFGPSTGQYAGPFAGPDVVGARDAPSLTEQLQAQDPNARADPNAPAPYAGPFAGPDVVGARDVQARTAEPAARGVLDAIRDALINANPQLNMDVLTSFEKGEQGRAPADFFPGPQTVDVTNKGDLFGPPTEDTRQAALDMLTGRTSEQQQNPWAPAGPLISPDVPMPAPNPLSPMERADIPMPTPNPLSPQERADVVPMPTPNPLSPQERAAPMERAAPTMPVAPAPSRGVDTRGIAPAPTGRGLSPQAPGLQAPGRGPFSPAMQPNNPQSMLPAGLQNNQLANALVGRGFNPDLVAAALTINDRGQMLTNMLEQAGMTHAQAVSVAASARGAAASQLGLPGRF